MDQTKLKAYSDEAGMIFTFTHSQLVFLKKGGVCNLEMISGEKKVFVKFMREKAYKLLAKKK